MEGGADLGDVGAVGADGVVELLAGDAELVGPVGDVGGELGIDLVGVVRALVRFFVGGVGFVGLGLLFVLVFLGVGGHAAGSSFVGACRWMRGARGGDAPGSE